MTLDQLAAFRAVTLGGSFSAAARQLHKSQPAVTKLVQNLEAELDLQLFDRSAYRATLTDAGRLFLERTADLLDRSEALRSFAHSLTGAAEPVIRLVVEAITPLPPLLQALREVNDLFPTLRYELRTEHLTGALEALEDKRADLAIAGKHRVDERAIEARAFAGVRIIPVVRHDHPLARAKPPVSASLLRKYAQIVLRDSARGELTQTVNVLSDALRWTVTEVSAKLEIIQAGMGWGGLPEHVVASALREGALRALDIAEFDVRVIPLYTLRRNDQAPGPVAEALWSRLAQR